MHHRRFTAIILVGVVGLAASLTFAYFSAPDLALTQLSVEVVTTVLMLVALTLMPQSSPTGIYPTHQTRDALLAIGAGGGVAGLAWAILTRPHESIAWYFIGESVPKGGGSNIVNVILVDFRGFDTFGEIIVLGIAGIGVMLLMDGLSVQPAAATRRHDHLLLSVAARVLLPFALLVSIFIFLRGHNLPGGGFIAGLVTAVALIIQYVADGMVATSRRLGNNVSPVIGVGVLIAGLTGTASWLFGAPFLTSTHGYWQLPLIGAVPLASAIAFDLGVYLTVVGATLLMLTRLGATARQGATLAGEGA
jgi:multicomponent K+:H+ antiporter subunit A